MNDYDYSDFAIMIMNLSVSALMDMHRNNTLSLLIMGDCNSPSTERIRMKTDLILDQLLDRVPLCHLMSVHELTKNL